MESYKTVKPVFPVVFPISAGFTNKTADVRTKSELTASPWPLLPSQKIIIHLVVQALNTGITPESFLFPSNLSAIKDFLFA